MTTIARKESPANDLDAVLDVLDSFGRAHRDKDAAGIVAHYAKDAVVFDLSTPLRSAMALDVALTQQWLDTWDGPVEIEPHGFQMHVAGDYAFGHGYLRMAGKVKIDPEPVDFWMRSTVALRRAGGVWRIAHEHTSVPFYMDGSLRPAFDLTPPA